MPGAFDESDLALLTEQERAILQDGDDDEDHDDTGSDDGDDDSEGADTGAGAGANTDDDGADADPEPQAAPARAEQAPVVYQSQAPADLAEQIKTINKDKADLFRQFSDGELAADEYSEREQALLDKRDELSRAKIKAEVSAEMAEQAASKQYSTTLSDFFAEQKRAGFDYHSPANAEALKMLDARVRALGALHEDNPQGWKALFGESHSAVAAKFSIKAAPASAADPGSKRRDRTPDLSNVPPVVGRAPAAQDPSIQGDEFAHLSGLSGIALEKAVARMTPEQQDRYLS